MQIAHVNLRNGEGKEAVDFLKTLGVHSNDYKLISSKTGDLLIINLLYGNNDLILDNLTTKYDFEKDKERSLVIFTPDAVIPKKQGKLKRAEFHTSRESMVNFARKKSEINSEYILLLILSSIITTLGLILDNVAVIVGGMVIAPVLGPILGITIGIVIGDSQLIRKGVSAEIIAVTIGIATGAFFTLLIPGVELTASLIIRTSPSLADLLIAMAAGAAGAYTMIRGELGSGLVGVMIAAALLPVMCTIGIGISMGNYGMVLGAGMLLTGNYLSLLLSKIVVFYFKGLKPQIWYKFRAEKMIKKSFIFIIISVFMLSIPLTIMTIYQFYREKPDSVIKSVIRDSFLEKWQYRIEAIEIKGNLVNVYLYSEMNFSKDYLLEIKKQIEEALNEEYTINFRIILVEEITV
ncbi:MAG TPA: TIGR00341 family protein [Halanaerobiales bacterium]|nr:TIGR00341 family protein [Halanaerobiales bacterium]